jgi:hypothetical protein
VNRKNANYVLQGESAGKVFRVNADTGDVYAFERLDREKVSEYYLTALIVDKDTRKNLEPPSNFTIKVHDVNDNWPVFTRRLFNASVPEMSPVGMCPICPSPSSLPHLQPGSPLMSATSLPGVRIQ